MGDLAVVCFSRHDNDGTADRFDESGVVGTVDLGFVSSAQHIGTKTLRSLDGHESGPVRCGHDSRNDCTDSFHIADFDHFHRVDHRQARDCPISTRDDCVNHRFEQSGRSKRACRVVDENDVRIVGHRLQPIAHAGRSGRSSSDDHNRSTRPRTILGIPVLLLDIVIGNDHDNAIAAGESRRHRMIDDPPTTEIFELFHRAESATRAAGNDDRPDCESSVVRRTTALDIGHER